MHTRLPSQHACQGPRRSQSKPLLCQLAALPRRQLGGIDLHVPNLCFGTMLFGEGTSLLDATALLNSCMESGITFFDTAEMYPVPQRAETAGMSELYLGQWMRSQARDRFTISTKVSGPGQLTWIRGGPVHLDAVNIMEAVEGSLRRLQTDYIDLIQLHWPDRYVPMFGDVAYDPAAAYTTTPLEVQLEALGRAVAAGKVRHVGLSNETPWGVMRCCHAAAVKPFLPRVVSVQNAYSLLCRTFDEGLAEVCHLEGLSLLAYSPLAMGLLTGKYLDPGGGPPNARLNRYRGRYAEAESRYGPRPNVVAAVAAYCKLAMEAGMQPTELAIRFVVGHPLVASAVIGATNLAQLQQICAAAAKPPLDQGVREAIDAIHALYPNPTP